MTKIKCFINQLDHKSHSKCPLWPTYMLEDARPLNNPHDLVHAVVTFLHRSHYIKYLYFFYHTQNMYNRLTSRRQGYSTQQPRALMAAALTWWSGSLDNPSSSVMHRVRNPDYHRHTWNGLIVSHLLVQLKNE